MPCSRDPRLRIRDSTRSVSAGGADRSRVLREPPLRALTAAALKPEDSGDCEHAVARIRLEWSGLP